MLVLKALMTADKRPCRIEALGGMAGPARLRVFAPSGRQFMDGSTSKVFSSIAAAVRNIPGEPTVELGDD